MSPQAWDSSILRTGKVFSAATCLAKDQDSWASSGLPADISTRIITAEPKGDYLVVMTPEVVRWESLRTQNKAQWLVAARATGRRF